jgi:predicted nuclease with TOPRIM domain
MLPTRCCPAHPSAAGTRHLWHRALPQPVPNPLECTAEVVWAAIRALRPLLRRYGECETLMTDTVDLTVLGRRIERMDDQLHGIVNRLDRIEGSIAIVDSHVGALTAEVHRFGERLDRYDERFDRLEQLLRDRPAPS